MHEQEYVQSIVLQKIFQNNVFTHPVGNRTIWLCFFGE